MTFCVIPCVHVYTSDLEYYAMANRVCSEVKFNALISSEAQLTFLLLLTRLWSCPSCQGKQHSCKINIIVLSVFTGIYKNSFSCDISHK